MLELKPPELLFPEIELPVLELPTEDGVPLETNWHRIEINLLVDSLHHHWRDQRDYFAGGNMFIYYSFEQVRNRDYRGPDFFVIKGVDGERDREAWIVWEEKGRYPNLIVELSSPTTRDVDLGPKKELYEQTFRTPEYFCYDPDQKRLMGWRLGDGQYLELEPNERGWLWSKELNLWLGTWEGEYLRITATWLRFHTAEGELVLTGEEAARAEAEAERRRAQQERRRAEQAEERARRLEEQLQALGAEPEE
ncbi:MAG: Uma2 family endonuclease [Anaerolineae bacterium]